MNQKERQKLCAQCDGRIPLEAVACPYCTADQASLLSREDAIYRKQQSLQDSLTALYTPPYAAKHSAQAEPKKGSSFMPHAEARSPLSLGSPTLSLEEGQQAEEKSSFWPLFFLSVGANLLMLGLLQLLFSEGGHLRLEWSSHYWFLYCLVAVPLLFLGFKKANQLR